MFKKLPKLIKVSFLVLLFSLKVNAQNTYYWVHNDLITAGTQYSKDQVNATNTGAGTAYWKHFSKVAGSTSTVDLVPAATPITSLDNIIIVNSSIPTRTVLANYNIMIDNTGGGLICQDFDASAWNPPAGQLQRLNSIQILTGLQVYRHFRLTPSDRFGSLSGTTLTFPNNSPLAVDSIHLYHTTQAGGNTFRYMVNLNINITTNGKVYFCDTIRSSTSNGPAIVIRANDNIGLTNEVHFLENISRIASITVEAGNLFVHKNVTQLRSLRVGGGFGGVNGASPNTVNSRFYAHAPGFYSSPGVWNTGYWNDPAYVTQGQNVWGRLSLVANRGVTDFQNTRMNDVSIYFLGNRGRGTIGSDSMGFFTNQTSYLRFRSAGTTFVKPLSVGNFTYTGYNHKGTWVVDQNPVVDNVTDYFSSAAPQFYHDTFEDTLLVATNIDGFGSSPIYTYSITIANTGYAKFSSGYTYNFGNYDYVVRPNSALFTVNGKLVIGDSRGCDSTTTRLYNANLVIGAAGTHTIANTQIDASKIQGSVTGRTILGSNTDMGGNNGFLFNLSAGQITMNGVVPSTAAYAYGTAPYNTVPFTGKGSRTLIWDDIASGSTTKYWSEKKWADAAISSTTFDQCPPTFIDSVIVNPGSTLKIDQRATQCKSFVALAGAPITLSQKATTAADSLSTLQVFGSFILNQKLNNMLNRNIMFRAWQTYPQIKTSGTNFWRGLNFYAINTGTNNPASQTNNGSWTLMDSLCAYNQDIVFTPRSNSAPECKKINFDKITYALYDPTNEFLSPGNNNAAVNIYFNYMLSLTAGNLYTNNKNIHTYNFYVNTDSRIRKKLFLGSSTFNLYDGTGEMYNVTGSTVQTYGSSWVTPDVTNSFTLSAGTSHIKFHTKTFMLANNGGSGGGNNATLNSFGSRGNRYYDVSFLCNDSIDAIYKRSTNSLTAPIYTVTGGAGITRSGVSRSINCNFRNITFWGSDASYPQMQTYRDTISKIIYKYNTGSLNSGAITTCTVTASVAIPMSATVTNSSIDSLIFETKTNSINANVALPGSGLYNIKRYLSFPPGSTNTFNPGDKHRIYNSATVVLTRKPWQDNTPAVPTDNPSYIAPAPYTAFTWAPYGAKVKSQSVCDAPTIVKFGGFTNAGNAVAYPTPYHWSGAAPRDTFDIKNWIVIDDSLTQFQTVDASVNLSGSTLNWDAGLTTPRTLVFRDGGAASASWFDKTKWAKVISYSPYTISAIGECIPQCGDSVIFDNASFSTPTNTCNLGTANSAYCGTMAWRTGVTGILDGGSTTVLTICNSLYFNPTMSNRFQGQTVFTAIDSNKVEYIQSSNKVFNNQVLFNQRNPSKYKTGWKLLDSLSTLPIANAIIPAMKVNAGVVDTRGKNLNLIGGFDINSTKNRGINFHNSKVYTTGGRAGYAASGNQTAFNIDGDYNKLYFKADSSDIYATSTQSAGVAWNANFYVWNGLASSQFYTATPKGFKFNKVTVTGMTSTGGTSPVIHLRSDTINTLTLTGKTVWYHFYKGYIKKCISNNPTTGPSQQYIGNLLPITQPLMRFNNGRIDTLRITHRVAASNAQLTWDTLYVKDEMTIQAGTAIQFAKGGLTWFNNKCNVQIVGTSALPISLNTNSSIGKTYNYPAPTGNRVQNEHYFRKDSGTVCTDYAQLYNIWAIGNGNGNNSCSGGAATFGCIADPVPNSSAYGTWMSPVMSPTLGVRTLSDTTFYSSETPNFPTSGRARFLAGNNADFGDPNPIATHNCAGWDASPYAGFPPTQLTLSQYTVCPNTVVTASLALTGPTKGKDFPITVTYSVGGVLSAYTFTSSASNPYTFTFTPTATTNTNVTWIDMANVRCFSNVQAVNASANITILPTPTLTAVQSGTIACAGAVTTLSASGASSYTWSTTQNTQSISVTPTITTTYSVVGTNTVGCYNSPPVTLTVNVNALPTMSVGAQTNVACFGGSTGAVTLTPTGGSGSGYSITPTTTINLAAGSYTYSVKDGANCTSTVIPVTITQPTAALTAITSNTANTDCVTPNGQAMATPSGGTSAYTYTWSNGANTQTISGLNGGTYSVTVTDNNNCTYTTQTTISNPSGPVITASSNTNTICSGNNITITPSGGTNYTVTPSVGSPTTITGATIFTPTTTTSYTVVGTNATSCLSNTVNFNVTVNATPVVTIAATSSVICNGQSTTLNLTGAATYTLVNTGASITSGTIFTPTTPTTYSIQGTSAAGCTGLYTQQLITVNALPSVSISATSASICAGNSATLTASGANTYTWTSGPIAATYTTSTAGVYTVTGRNTSTGCTNTQTVNLSINALPSVSISATSASVCAGNTVTYTATGANTYSWSGGPASATYTTSTAGTYTVTGTDGNGCINTKTVNLTVSALPIVTIAATSSVICNGQSTILNLTGASTYTLVNTGSTITSGTVFTPTTNTTYSIQGTSAAGCAGANTQQLITVNALPTITVSATTQTLCSGQTATLTATGANTYTWTSPSVTTPTNAVSPTTNTTYSVIGTSTANCNSIQQTIAIIVNQTPTVSIASVSSPTICSGNTTTITPNGANTYTLTSSTQTLTISPFVVNPTANTTYTLTGLSTLNCASTNMVNTTIAVNQTPTVAIASVSNPTICSGNTTTITPNGASTYTLTSATQTLTTSPFVVSPTANTTYTLVGTSALNCPANNTANTTINVNTTPTVGISSSTTSICSGNTATLTASGATTYTWTNPSNTNTVIAVSPTSTQVYTLQGSSLNCNSAIQTVTLTVNQLPIIATTTVINVSCFGANNGSVIFTTTAGTPTYVIAGTNVSGTTASGLAPTDYTYTVTDAAGCVNTTTLSITQPTAALAANAAVTATNSSCTSPNGAFAITATGGTMNYTYTIDGGSPTTNSVTTNLSSGPHTYEVTDANGCVTTTGTVTISGTPGITSSVSNKLDVLCFGNNTASVTVTGAGGSTYDYTLTPITATTSAQNNTNGTFTGLSSGTYSVLVKDQISNCISTNTITISTPTAALALTGVTANSVVCNGGTAQVTTTVTGGTTPYAYVWSANTSTLSTATYTAGNYSVNINDANGCLLATQNFTINEAPVLNITSVATTTTGCGLSNGTATINANGGWNGSYTYSINGVSQSTNTATGLPAATYTADVMDALGCTTQTIFVIANPTTPTLSIASNNMAICVGNNATITPTGASSYTMGAVNFTTSTSVNPGSTTVYNITGTDAANCTSAPLSVTVTVNELPTLSLASSNAAICAGQTATLTASTTGTTTVDTYTWSTGSTTVNTTTVSPTAQTVYTVVGTNTVTGCVSAVQSVTVDINQNPTLAVASQTNVTCLGSTDGIVTFTTDASSYTITPATTGLGSGAYTFTVTDLATTCTNTVSATIAAPSASLAIASVATTTTGCGLANGTATITANGGWNTSYTYSLNAVSQSTNTLTGLPAATYTADVTDALGCTTQTVFTITNPNSPTLSIDANPAAICAGQSVTLTPNGAISYTLNGTTTFTTDITLNPSSTTVYNITGTDASSCTSTPLTVTVNVNALPTISVASTSSAICAGNNATLTATQTGTTTIDTYSWSTGVSTTNTETVSPTTQTVYTVAGTNTLTGCVSSVQSITVNVNATPTVAVASQTNVLCFGSTNGTIVLSSSSTNTTVVEPTTNLAVGDYTFTIVDNTTTCTNTLTATITGPTVALTAVVNNTTTNTSCATPNGAFTVTANGGTPSYTYNATNTTGIFVNQGTGTQNITVADANGCTYTVSATIPGIATPSVSATTQTNVLCNGQATGAAAVTVTGGTPTYTYTWSNNAGLNSNTQPNLSVGAYTVTATDAGSCTATQVFVITQPNAMNVITTNTTAPCVGQSNGNASIEISGGTPNYNVAWNPTSTIENTNNTSTISNIGEGSYIATVTDANSCSYQHLITIKAEDGIGCTLQIPEIYSPNGDGKNDTWEIKGLENYPNNNVTVFNRWGDQVFKAEPYKNDWDGTNAGDKSILGKGTLPVGTYYFILDLGNGDKPITGYVQLTK